MNSELHNLIIVEISNVLKCKDSDIKRETCAADIASWDSMNNIILLVTLEKKLNIKFNGMEALSLENVGQLIDLIELKMNNK